MPAAFEILDVMRVGSTTRYGWTGLTGTRTAPKRDRSMIGRKSPVYFQRNDLNDRGYLDAELCASIPVSGASDNKAESFHHQELSAVGRRSVLSRHRHGSIESGIPLRGYFLSVGGALLSLLLAADWVLPAPLPSRLVDSHPAVPLIRIQSELKRPEAIVIDTTRPDLMLLRKDNAAAPSQLTSSDLANAVQQPLLSLSEPVDGTAKLSAISTQTISHAREALAQLGPDVADRVGPSRRPGKVTSEPQRTFAQTRNGKRHRSAQHPASIPLFAGAFD